MPLDRRDGQYLADFRRRTAETRNGVIVAIRGDNRYDVRLDDTGGVVIAVSIQPDVDYAVSQAVVLRHDTSGRAHNRLPTILGLAVSTDASAEEPIAERILRHGELLELPELPIELEAGGLSVTVTIGGVSGEVTYGDAEIVDHAPQIASEGQIVIRPKATSEAAGGLYGATVAGVAVADFFRVIAAAGGEVVEAEALGGAECGGVADAEAIDAPYPARLFVTGRATSGKFVLVEVDVDDLTVVSTHEGPEESSSWSANGAVRYGDDVYWIVALGTAAWLCRTHLPTGVTTQAAITLVAGVLNESHVRIMDFAGTPKLLLCCAGEVHVMNLDGSGGGALYGDGWGFLDVAEVGGDIAAVGSSGRRRLSKAGASLAHVAGLSTDAKVIVFDASRIVITRSTTSTGIVDPTDMSLLATLSTTTHAGREGCRLGSLVYAAYLSGSSGSIRSIDPSALTSALLVTMDGTLRPLGVVTDGTYIYTVCVDRKIRRISTGGSIVAVSAAAVIDTSDIGLMQIANATAIYGE